MKLTVRSEAVLACDECGAERSSRYRVETRTLPCQLDLCPKCFGELLRKIANFAADML